MVGNGAVAEATFVRVVSNTRKSQHLFEGSGYEKADLKFSLPVDRAGKGLVQNARPIPRVFGEPWKS